MRRRKIVKFCYWLLICSTLLYGEISAAGPIESYRYLETAGSDSKNVHWCVIKEKINQLIYRTEEEIHVTSTDDSLATTQWQMKYPAKNTLLRCTRKDDTLVIKGRFKDKPVDKVIQIDDAPWYQATSWSLRRFILSDAEQIRFWTLRPDNLEAHKVEAVKKTRESISINGEKILAQQVELHLTGLLAPFWKSRYWFDPDKGVFLQFKGPSGPPGAPEVVIAYRGPDKPCDPILPEQLMDNVGNCSYYAQGQTSR